MEIAKPKIVKREISLQEQGFRFVGRAGRFFWCHPAEMREDDIDCTDMDDNTFANTILASRAPSPGVPLDVMVGPLET